MNAKRHDRLTTKEIDSARDAIAEAVLSERYIEYAEGQGPLALDQLVVGGPKMHEAVAEVAVLVGWPDVEDMKSIKLPKVYKDNEAFLEALLEDSSANSNSAISEELLADPETDIKALIEALAANPAPEKKHVNELKNFKIWLFQEPSTALYHYDEGFDAMYARHPALHRLYAVMPDLVNPMRKLLVHIRDKHRLTADHGADTAGFNKELSLGINADLVTAMRMTYVVVGRLLTTDDERLQYQLASGRDGSHVPKITDAFQALTT